MVLINDGKGRGRSASVNEAQQLNVHAVTNSFLQYESEANGNAYTWSTGSISTGGAKTDSALMIKNTARGYLHIDRIIISSTTNGAYDIRVTTINNPSGTVVSGLNMNTQSGNVPDALSYYKETTNKGSGEIISSFFVGAYNPFTFDTRGLFLSKNKCLTITSASASTMSVTVFGHYVLEPVV